MTIGQRLAERRRKLDLTLRDVEDDLRIRLKYLEAIEADAFDELPGEAYVKGILRAYASYLGLDPDAVVREYEEATARPEPPIILTKVAALRSPSALVLAVLVALLALAAVWLVIPERPSQPQLPVAPTDSLAPTATPPPTQPATGTPIETTGATTAPAAEATASAASRPYRVTIAVVGDDACWVLLRANGRTFLARTLRPGDIVSIDLTSSARLQLGRPAAVRLAIDGRAVDVPRLPTLEATLTAAGLAP